MNSGPEHHMIRRTCRLVYLLLGNAVTGIGVSKTIRPSFPDVPELVSFSRSAAKHVREICNANCHIENTFYC